MELTNDQLVLAVVVFAAIVGIYLLRHVIVLAFRLIVLAAVVLALVWVWQHRGDLADAAEPWLGPVGERLGALDLSFVRGVLTDLLSDGGADGDGGTPTGGTGELSEVPDATEGTEAVVGTGEPIVEPGAADGTEMAVETAAPEEPRGRGDPNAPE